MRRALELALLGRGKVEPNPVAGAVVLLAVLGGIAGINNNRLGLFFTQLLLANNYRCRFDPVGGKYPCRPGRHRRIKQSQTVGLIWL